MTPACCRSDEGNGNVKHYRTNIKNVPLEGGLREEEGWFDMQVRFLINEKTTGNDKLVVGWTVLPSGAKHDRHLHRNCDEFFVVVKGHGMIYTADGRGEEPAGEGDVLYAPRGTWHGFNNTSDKDVVLVWGWSGAGSLEASGYEVHPDVAAEVRR
jgi:mannose-6-phosphate isomerase-like protein (cupin superfamily)